MSITRKDIKAILPDIEDDAMRNLLNLIHDETDTLKDKYEALEKDFKKAEADLKDANAAKEKAESDLTDYKNQQTANETKSAKESAYKKLLELSGVGEKHRNLILKATNLDALELNKDGTLKNADKLSESIKTDYGDYITTTSVKGADVSNPPKSGNSGKFTTKDEIMAIKNTAERQAAIADNPELFGI